MTWIALSVVLSVVCGAGFVVGGKLKKSGDPYGNHVRVGSLVVLLVVVGGYSALKSVNQIPAGHTGVVYQFGGIVDQVPEGLQVVAPWRDVTIASIQVQRHSFDQLTNFSRETQDVFIKATLNYRVAPHAIQDLYRRVGPNWFEALVESRVNQIFKDETVKYRAVEIAPKREEIRTSARERLTKELEPFSIDVVDLLIDNVDFSGEFKRSIEEKQVATQNALREQERVKQKEYEKLQRIKEAEARAESTLIEATAQAEANRLLAESLEPILVQWQMVEKLSSNIKVMLLPSDQGLLFDFKSLTDELGEGQEERPQEEEPEAGSR